MTADDEQIEQMPTDEPVSVTLLFGGGTRDFEFQLWGEDVYTPGRDGKNTQER